MSQSPKNKLVVFVGAGFSAPFGIPVMSAFSDKLRDEKFLSAPEQREFDNIQLTCDQMGALVGSSSRNLEQLSSFLAVQHINDPEFRYLNNEKYRTPQDALELVTKCVYHLVKPRLTTDDVAGKVQLFDDALFDGNQVTFVTTNYDLVLELIGLQRNKRLLPTPLVRQFSNSNDFGSIYSFDDDAPRLFKLHGSVNWFRPNGDGESLWVVSKVAQIINSNARRIVDHTQDPTSVAIVPPSVIKPKIDNLLCEQWRGATDAIKDADAVWFVGYSFPESDSFMRYFVASAFATNTKIRQLVVIDPDSKVKARCLNIFRAERLKEVFAFLPLKWEQMKFGPLADGKMDEASSALLLDRLEQRDQRNRIIRACDD